MKYFGFIKKSIYIGAIVFLVAIASTVVAGRLGVGGVRALVVQSGSMEPSIGKNSVVVTAPSDSYAEGDVVTFRQSGRADVLVTHRIQSVSDGNFVTKGDANEEADGEVVPAEDVVGKAVFSVPYLGAIISFVQTPVGFVALVVVPAVVVVYGEVLNIKRQVAAFFENRRKENNYWKVLN